MTFYIFTSRTNQTILSDGEIEIAFASEGDAIDAAVRMAQDLNSLYKINYWRP